MELSDMSQHEHAIRILEDYPHPPGPRYRRQGKGSGQEFRDGLLRPKFDEALKQACKLIVYLEGQKDGYPTSFLEEAFGGLARVYGIEKVLDTLVFVAPDEPLLVKEIRHYIHNCHEIPGVPFED